MVAMETRHRGGVAVGDDEGGVGEGGPQRSELLEVLGRLEDPACAAAQELEDLQDRPEVLVGGGLVAVAVVVAPRRDQRRRLEEHGGDVDGQELDLLVDVVDGHLVHPGEVREGLIEDVEGEGGAGQTGIGGAGRRAFGRRPGRARGSPSRAASAGPDRR